ncbi:MAG: hypothetical protein JRI75_06205 [Deltaproteobacteria bacterium]|nr:hypothetical protein [Deltaproteobacteria bacterium]
MKKIICIVCCLGFFTVTGCDILKKAPPPEAVGKKYIEERFKGAGFDVSGLQYTVVNQAEDKASVKISGTIAFNEELQLVKKDGIWQIKTETEETLPEPKKEH